MLTPSFSLYRFVVSRTSGAEYICRLSSRTARLTKAGPAQAVTAGRAGRSTAIGIPGTVTLVTQTDSLQPGSGSGPLLSRYQWPMCRGRVTGAVALPGKLGRTRPTWAARPHVPGIATGPQVRLSLTPSLPEPLSHRVRMLSLTPSLPKPPSH